MQQFEIASGIQIRLSLKEWEQIQRQRRTRGSVWLLTHLKNGQPVEQSEAINMEEIKAK